MEINLEKSLTPNQLQSIHDIVSMVDRGESTPIVEQLWNDLLQKSTQSKDVSERLNVILAIWTTFEETLNGLDFCAIDHIENCGKSIAEKLSVSEGGVSLSNSDLQILSQEIQKSACQVSSISKCRHETAVSVIQNLRA